MAVIRPQANPLAGIVTRGCDAGEGAACAAQVVSDPCVGWRETEGREATMGPETFDALVETAGNKLARAAALAVADASSAGYDLLVIWGGPASGKTHLLRAIAARARARHPDAVVESLTAEGFASAYVDAIVTKSTKAFRRGCLMCEVLLIDDVQHLRHKEGTQIQLRQAIEDRSRAGLLTVVSSNVHPHELSDFDPDLWSRLQGGLTVGIRPPSVNERREIILAWAQQQTRTPVPAEVLDYLAQQELPDLRAYRGALISALASAELLGEDVTLEFVRRSTKEPAEALAPCELPGDGEGYS